jgi:hypothetical protein
MKTNFFNTNFTIENYADYLSLVFEDTHFPAEELKPFVLKGIKKGLERYAKRKRKSNMFVYVTYFVKVEVENYKKSKLLINLTLRKR